MVSCLVTRLALEGRRSVGTAPPPSSIVQSDNSPCVRVRALPRVKFILVLCSLRLITRLFGFISSMLRLFCEVSLASGARVPLSFLRGGGPVAKDAIASPWPTKL